MPRAGGVIGHDGGMKLEAADFAAMDDSAKLAVLESLLIAIYADGVVMPEEVQRFDQIVARLPWGMEPPVLMALAAGAKARLDKLTTPVAISDFVAGVAARITAPRIREKVVYTMASIAAADGKLHQFEKNILGLYAVSFGITSDRIAEIKAALEAGEPAT